MDKTKEYKIINTLNINGQVSDSAKHRIGRVGKFIRLIKGMRFEFLFDYKNNISFRSSKVEKIEESGSLIKVYTLNTIYEFVVNEK